MNETLGPGARPAAATTSQPYGWDAAVACTRVAVAVAVVAVVWALGGTFETDAALQEMGFDPERARLIVALIVAALAATTVSLIGGGRRLSTFTGLMAEMAWFGGTFIDETSRVLGGSDTTGQFEPLGWLLTLASLVAAGIGVSWAAAVLAREAHDAILASIATLGFTGKRQSAFGRAPRKDVSKESPRAPATGWHRAVPLSRLLVVAVIAAVTLPILGDMFNYVPDIHMQSGGASGIAISDESSGGETPAASAPAEARVSGSARPVAPASPGPDGFPGNLVPGPVKGSLVTPGSLGSDDWGPAPSGAGRTMTVRLPAPWKDGTSNTTAVDIYLPPGYDDSETRYPVFYQAPANASVVARRDGLHERDGQAHHVRPAAARHRRVHERQRRSVRGLRVRGLVRRKAMDQLVHGTRHGRLGRREPPEHPKTGGSSDPRLLAGRLLLSGDCWPDTQTSSTLRYR